MIYEVFCYLASFVFSFQQMCFLKTYRTSNRKITDQKLNVFLRKGIFHHSSKKVSTELKAVRHRFSSKNGYERIVFDFISSEAPKVYGHISGAEKKLYMDIFDTELGKAVYLGSSKYVKSINFFPIDSDSLSVEVDFKENVAVDIFVLKTQSRFVLDLKP